MEEEWRTALAELESVWTRVQSGTGPVSGESDGAGEDAAVLRRAMQRESDAAARYAALARLWDGRSAETLRGFAAQCSQNLKQLETDYFLLTGDTFTCERLKLPNDGLLGYLRRAYREEGDAEQMYFEAAAAAEQRERCKRFRELEQSCARRREALYALAYRVLG